MKPVILPKFDFTQEDAQLVRWIRRDGETVEQGEPIAEVTSDKTNMEIEAPASGILAGIRVQEGETVPVTEVIAYILGPGETLPVVADLAPATAPGTDPPQGHRSPVSPVAARVAAERGIDGSQVTGTGPGGRVTRRDVEGYIASGHSRATPAARRASRELGVPLTEVRGSGPAGRVQEGDVLATLRPGIPAEDGAPDSPKDGRIQVVPLVGMRRTIAMRMQRSSQEAPHITLSADVEVRATEALRARVNDRLADSEPKVSLTAMIAQVVAWALRRHPFLNSRLDGERILLLPDVNLGIAVALEDGLIVPVVRQAERKNLVQLAAEIADLSERARRGRLRPDDVTDGSFTITNLGMFGVDRFSAILNPPQSGILAIGRVRKRVVPDEEDRPVVRPVMVMSLSVDHRVVDGAVAARFLGDLRAGLEEPSVLLM